jgi:hypothetical protein
MKLRLMQLLLFFPCCFIDGLFAILIWLPLWVVCGISITSHEGTLEWLMELNKNERGNK